MRRALVSTVALLLLARYADAAGACTSRNGWTANWRSVRLVLPPGMPATVQQGIEEGAGAWNSGGCNVGANDFPVFSLSGPSEQTIDVILSNDIREVCSSLTSAAKDGTDATLILHNQVRDGTSILDCNPSSGAVADTVAHELGHYLGLADTLCSDYIMGQQPLDITDTSQEIQHDECSAADSNNSTTAEQVQEAGGAPTPPRPTHTAPGSPPGTPIIIDLAGNGFALTGLDAGVRFDIDGDGHEEQVSWTSRSSEDVFLALDRNGNGWIDDGTELFGNFTLQPPSNTPNGYLALAVFDDNGDARITSLDQVYGDLRLWNDANHDGLSQTDEIATLQGAGVAAVHLDYLESRLRDRHGNEFRYWSIVQLRSRRSFVLSADVFFRVRD